MKDPKKHFLKGVKELHRLVKGWLEGSTIQIENLECAVLDTHGFYSAPVLALTDDNARLARLAPIGADVIRARGRVDIIGTMDRCYLLFQPTGHRAKGCHWYFHSPIDNKICPLDKKSFLDLLYQVSDYQIGNVTAW